MQGFFLLNFFSAIFVTIGTSFNQYVNLKRAMEGLVFGDIFISGINTINHRYVFTEVFETETVLDPGDTAMFNVIV